MHRHFGAIVTTIVCILAPIVPATAAGGAETYRDSATGMEFVSVEGGCFKMGSTVGDSDEQPIHEVCLDGFLIGKYEVTQAQWKAVMGANPSKMVNPDRPVETVSWNDVQEFIARLNKKAGKQYRLPTEAEWEFAARGGTKSQGYTYPGSNTLDQVAWTKSNAKKETKAVGTLAPNELGIHDMAGNVWEWVFDWYAPDYYGKSEKNNPKGPQTGANRVKRGAGFHTPEDKARTANRSTNNPGRQWERIGFRLALAK